MGNSMAAILRNVIRSGGMPLAQVSERIETMYLTGQITGEERAELTEMMHGKASPENEAGDYKALYKALLAKYGELAARMEAVSSLSLRLRLIVDLRADSVWINWSRIFVMHSMKVSR